MQNFSWQYSIFVSPCRSSRRSPDLLVGWREGHPPHSLPLDTFGVSFSVPLAPRLRAPPIEQSWLPVRHWCYSSATNVQQLSLHRRNFRCRTSATLMLNGYCSTIHVAVRPGANLKHWVLVFTELSRCQYATVSTSVSTKDCIYLHSQQYATNICIK